MTGTGPTPPSDRRDPSVIVAWLVATLAVVAPFWVAVVPPMTDVSQHVLVARILDAYGDAAYRFSHYFTVAWTGAPTELFYLVLAALQSRLGPYTDAKVYLSGFVVALSLSAWALARVLRVEAPWLAGLLVLPLGACWYVYGGLLPFVITFPLFALTVAVWASELRLPAKLPLLWVLLLLLYAFHVVGAVAAAGVIATAAVLTAARPPRSLRPLVTAAIAGVPLAAVVARYLAGMRGPTMTLQYGGLVYNLVHTLLYTCASLATSGRFFMLAWLVAIGAAGLWQWHRGRLPAWLVACVALLATASVLLPASLGALWPAGPRLFPYALILLVSGLSWPRRYARGVGLAALVVVLGMNLANGLKARALDREFRSFLSAVDLVDPGSKLLPILVDPYAGSKSIWPFWSLPSAYNVYRGGASPYVFATPYVKTGASPLQYRHRDEFGYAFLYEPGQPASAYRGVAGAYDYVLVWGVDPDLDAVLGRELALVHRDGAFRLYAAPAPERAERKRREAP